ncbi:hypothetical protein HDV00_003524 [Rhizophlyctis rosea]|nr:hypothetical protein HDV00_003524 [Rhizophlyctis rosea]
MATNKEKAGDPNTLPTEDHRSDSAESITTETIQAPAVDVPPTSATEGAHILNAPSASITTLAHSHPNPVHTNPDGTSDLRGLAVDETGVLYQGADADKIDEGKHTIVYGIGTEVGYVGEPDGQPLEEPTAVTQTPIEASAEEQPREGGEGGTTDPSLAHLDVTRIEDRADPNTIAVLADLEQTIHPSIFTNDTLPLHHPSAPTPIGTRTLSIDQTNAPTHSAAPAYIINCRTRADIPFTTERLEEDLFAIVGTRMETYVQKSVRRIYRINGEEGGEGKTGSTEEIMEEIRLDERSGNLYVKEGGSGVPDAEWLYAGEDVKGFLSQAALYVLTRILSLSHHPESLNHTFLWYNSNTHTILRMPFHLDPYAPPRVISDITLRTTRITASIALSLPPEGDFAERKEEEDFDQGQGEGDEGVVVTGGARVLEETYVGEFTTEEGICVYEKLFGVEFASVLEELPQSLTGPPPPVDKPYDTRDFGGNIELISEYKERKRELTAAHQAYIEEHPELRSVMADYLQLLLHRKPEDVYAFTAEYFSIAGK